MTLLHSLLLGLLEGLTEFIPVSSTAHMLVAQRLLDIPSSEAMFAFLILVQIGPLVALILYFRKDLLSLVRSLFARPFSTPENRLVWYIIIATIPALLAGVLLKHIVQELFKTPLLEAAVRLLAAAVLLTLAEAFGNRTRRLESMTWLDALVVGFMQVIAVFPGASRSGTTISGGMLLGFDRPSAARFAFLMSVPVMLAAAGYESLDLLKGPGLGSFLPLLAAGFITAAIVGWLSIKWLLAYLNHHSLYIFAAYCAAAGILTLALQLL